MSRIGLSLHNQIFSGPRARGLVYTSLGAVLLTITGLASHNHGESPSETHPTWSGYTLVAPPAAAWEGAINMRLRDNDSGTIRVLADVHQNLVDQAIGRWNNAMGRQVFVRVTSGAYDIRVRKSRNVLQLIQLQCDPRHREPNQSGTLRHNCARCPTLSAAFVDVFA
jgi:hypothetical protein